MAASLTGLQHYPQAVAFLSSPLLNVSYASHCMTFSYTLRSNLRVKITSHSRTVTLINWGVDGGRAFHRAAIDLPRGIYKIIWETTDLREHLSNGDSPHNHYRAIVTEIEIHPMDCHFVGRFHQLWAMIWFDNSTSKISSENSYHMIRNSHNGPITQIPQCIRQISHNASNCSFCRCFTYYCISALAIELV